MVERGGLENRCAFAGTVGSNPTLSANFLFVAGRRYPLNNHYYRTFCPYVVCVYSLVFVKIR